MTEQAEITAFYELSQAKARYCRALDTRDWDGLAERVTADVEFGMSDGDADVEMITGAATKCERRCSRSWRTQELFTKSICPRSISTVTKRK